jgi:hypothetical protein
MRPAARTVSTTDGAVIGHSTRLDTATVDRLGQLP